VNPNPIGPERRLRRLWLNPDVILHFFTANPLDSMAVALPRALNLPQDARVHSVWAEEAPLAFGLLVEHPSFDPVPPGEAPPRIEMHTELYRVHRFQDEHGRPCLAQPGRAEDVAAGLVERVTTIGTTWTMMRKAIHDALLAYGARCCQAAQERAGRVADERTDAQLKNGRLQARIDNLEAENRALTQIADERNRLLAAIIEHHNQKADDRCVEDDDKLYEAAGLSPVDRRVGDKEAMLANCARFIDRRCEGGGWPSYRELEEQLATLSAQLAEERQTQAILEELLALANRALRRVIAGEVPS
jgi:hypothetical protein